MAATAVAGGSSNHFAMMSRPQIGIDRLPVRRPSTNEPKEAMNCKSCRKRKVRAATKRSASVVANIYKIKCNRVKPSCEACQVFNCACVYGMAGRNHLLAAWLTDLCQTRFPKSEDRRQTCSRHS